jgi:lipid II:glycine glycyltransferase (peptidoglycan interpeptide bridge formation enzyme)
MTIRLLDTADAKAWNAFVAKHFPPVGAFMQSYEWGDFKQKLHGKVMRFAIEEAPGGEKQKTDTAQTQWLGCFQLEIHTLPFGFSYGYAPRGPVLRKDFWDQEKKVDEIFKAISLYLKQQFPHLMFIRFEPPHVKHFSAYEERPLSHPAYYLQPRFNQLVTIAPPEDMLKTFSSDIKHDIRAAERIGTTIRITTELSPAENEAFEGMKIDTLKRSGKSIFPSDTYFTNFLQTFTKPLEKSDTPRLCFFIASNKDGVPVAINLNILFGKTLTYLYGASSTGSISKRAPGYLHWKTMEYAREHDFLYYDLGGVDANQWGGLTYFKRQFGGETLEYIGTVDAVLHPKRYAFYNAFKRRDIASKK